MSVLIGTNPIAWSNDDMPELGGETPLEVCLSEAKQAGYEGIEMGGKFPTDPQKLRPVLERHGSMTPAEMARLLRLSEGAVSSVLSMLAQEGKLRIARVELPPRDDGRQLSL